MAFVDKTLTCRECGNPFTFTSGEQEFHQSRGFENEPGRCPECRAARRTREGGGSYAGSRPRTADRPMFDVVCSQCGKETTVPFQPRGDRPVYCSDCFRAGVR